MTNNGKAAGSAIGLLCQHSLFVTGEGLSTVEVRAPDYADINAPAACSPVLAQPGVEQDPLV
jgi:hypothetical protein